MLGRTRIHLPGGARPSNGTRLASAPYCAISGLLAWLLPALALAEPLLVDTLKGVAEYRTQSSQPWQRLTQGQSLTLPAEIRTGDAGAATLKQSGSSFELKPATVIALDSQGGDSLRDINQSTGTVFYRVQDQGEQLNIVTPTLRATVAGTEFIIVATPTSSFVTLAEGDLTVIDRRSGEMRNLNPGEVASSSTGSSGVTTFNSVTPAPQAAMADEGDARDPAPFGTDDPPGEDGFDAAFAGLDEMATEQDMVAAEESGAFAAEDDMGGADPGSVADDMPADDQGPVEDDMPADDQGPVEDDMPTDDQGPVEDDMPTDDQGPVEDDMPTDDQGPVEDDMPSDEGPVEDDMPGDDEGPVEDDMPGDDEGPVEDDMPGDDEGPVEDDMPGDDEGPVEDDMPNEEEGPVEDDLPIEDEGPVEDDMPTEGDGSGGDDADDDDDNFEHCPFGWCHEHRGPPGQD